MSFSLSLQETSFTVIIANRNNYTTSNLYVQNATFWLSYKKLPMHIVNVVTQSMTCACTTRPQIQMCSSCLGQHCKQMKMMKLVNLTNDTQERLELKKEIDAIQQAIKVIDEVTKNRFFTRYVRKFNWHWICVGSIRLPTADVPEASLTNGHQVVLQIIMLCYNTL